MQTLIEIAKEKGAEVFRNFGDTVNKITLSEAQLQAAHDDYCKQFEPIGEVHELSNGWECYIWQKAIDDGLIKDGDFVYAHPPQIPSEVKAYVERLEAAMNEIILHDDSANYVCEKMAKKALASKPACLKE